MAGVDDAEAVSFRVSEDDEVGIARIIPGDSRRTQPYKSSDLGRLLGRIINNQVEVDTRVLLYLNDGPMQRDPGADTIRRDQDREAVR